MSQYEDKIKRKFNELMTRLNLARDIEHSSIKASPEEMYKGIEDSFTKSLGEEGASFPEKLLENKNTNDNTRSGSRSLGRATESFSKDYLETLRETPVDEKGRKLLLKYDPESDYYHYIAAVPDSKSYDQKLRWQNMSGVEGPIEMPTKDIASLKVSDNGHVGFLKSSFQGAKEEAINRLLLEAAKDKRYPYSSNLLPSGKNAVIKRAIDFKSIPKTEYIKKLIDFLDSGKAGKIWSSISPIVKPLGLGLGAAGALMSPDIASAAADVVVPGGVEELNEPSNNELEDMQMQQYNPRWSKIKKIMEK